MRNITLLALAAAAVVLGGADAFAMGGGNLSPEQSPYALIAPQTLQQSPVGEGRAAYTGGDPGYSAGYGAQPVYVEPPEERNYYSRGR